MHTVKRVVSHRLTSGRDRFDISTPQPIMTIMVDMESIGATRHMGAPVTRHGAIIPPMNGAGTRPNGMDSTLYLTAS